MSAKVDRAISAILTMLAIVFTGVLLKREFWPNSGAPVAESTEPTRVTNWNELVTTGLSLQAHQPKIVVVEFADLECPVCSAFHRRLQTIVADLNADVGVVLQHFPLAMHRFARPSARALECANSFGIASQFLTAAYAQDSFGIKSWTQFAHEEGVQDTLQFGRSCATRRV
jgi:peroxiredoxin